MAVAGSNQITWHPLPLSVLFLESITVRFRNRLCNLRGGNTPQISRAARARVSKRNRTTRRTYTCSTLINVVTVVHGPILHTYLVKLHEGCLEVDGVSVPSCERSRLPNLPNRTKSAPPAPPTKTKCESIQASAQYVGDRTLQAATKVKRENRNSVDDKQSCSLLRVRFCSLRREFLLVLLRALCVAKSMFRNRKRWASHERFRNQTASNNSREREGNR